MAFGSNADNNKDTFQLEKAMKWVDKALIPNVSHRQNQLMYTEWSSTYDKDHELLQLIGPKRIGQIVADLFPQNRNNVSILDVAAGTGLVGQELRRHGFEIIDALEANASMLYYAEKKQIHRKLFLEAVPDMGKTSVESNSYDVVTCRGGFGNGGLPVNAIPEMIRLAKSGGYIVIITGGHNFELPAYKTTLRPLMKYLEESGEWTNIKEDILENAIMSSCGVIRNVIFIYKKNVL